MAEVWQVRLLGGLWATRGEREIRRFRSRKVGALFAYLAFHVGRPQPRGELVERFWPESDPEAGRNSLRVALASLRRQLESPETPLAADWQRAARLPPGALLIADRNTIYLHPAAIATDVAAFEAALQRAARASNADERGAALRQAVEEYGGELLPGCLDDWALLERQRLAELFQRTVGELVGHLELAGDRSGALAVARRAVSADPLREDAHRRLIRLLIADGQPGAARQQFDELKRRLAVELGTTPDSATGALLVPLEGGRPTGLETDLAASRRPDGSRAVLCILPEDEAALAAHGDTRWVRCRDLLRPLLHGYGGHVSAAEGGIEIRFAGAGEALAAALAATEIVRSFSWPSPLGAPRPRMALDIGGTTAEEADPRADLSGTARLARAARGGQLLLSESAAEALRECLPPGVWLTDLGLYRPDAAGPPRRLFEARASAPPVASTPSRDRDEVSLPLTLSRFFGREREIATLVSLMTASGSTSTPRLVTLTGPGGSGKTRLAVEVAERLRSIWRGTMRFVPLAEVASAEGIGEAIRNALRLPGSPGSDAWEQVVAALAQQPALLLLDNFEHLLPGTLPGTDNDDGALRIRDLLARAPTLTCLVTSRRRLDLAGEREFPVAPLPVPAAPLQAPGATLHVETVPSLEPGAWSLERLLAFPSVQLFLDRAQAVRPDFQLTPANASAVATLCARLEGLPLALELAAGRAGALTPAQMLAGLEHRFDLLVGRHRDVAARHRTLRATLDWSYRLLAPELQRFFSRLSVFRGGWASGGAAEVCEEPKALLLLEELRSCSLVLADAAESIGGEEMRFRFLETVREYAAEQLSPAEAAAIAHQHARHYVALAEQATASGLTAEERARWRVRLDQEQPNLLLVLDEAIALGEADRGLRLGALLWTYWTQRGPRTEAHTRLRRLLRMDTASAPTLSRARVLLGAGAMLHQQGEYDAVAPLLEESLATFRILDDHGGVAHVLHQLALLAWERGEFDVARERFEASLSIERKWKALSNVGLMLSHLGAVLHEMGDDAAARPILEEGLSLERQHAGAHALALALNNSGLFAHRHRDLDTARTCHEEALGLQRRIGDKHCSAVSLHLLGRVLQDQADLEAASAALRESLVLRRELGEKRGTAECLEAFAGVAAARGQFRQATRWLATATCQREAIGAPRSAWDEPAFEARVAELRAALGEAVFQQEWAAGCATESVRAAAEVLEGA